MSCHVSRRQISATQFPLLSSCHIHSWSQADVRRLPLLLLLPSPLVPSSRHSSPRVAGPSVSRYIAHIMFPVAGCAFDVVQTLASPSSAPLAVVLPCVLGCKLLGTFSTYKFFSWRLVHSSLVYCRSAFLQTQFSAVILVAPEAFRALSDVSSAVFW